MLLVCSMCIPCTYNSVILVHVFFLLCGNVSYAVHPGKVPYVHVTCIAPQRRFNSTSGRAEVIAKKILCYCFLL